MQSYRELTVWQRSIDLVKSVYALTQDFPKEEKYGLGSQMRRAVVSIPSNIAEGYARKHKREYSQFVRVAFGSGAELETQLEIARQLGFGSTEKVETTAKTLDEVMKMLNKLANSLNPSG